MKDRPNESCRQGKRVDAISNAVDLATLIVRAMSACRKTQSRAREGREHALVVERSPVVLDRAICQYASRQDSRSAIQSARNQHCVCIATSGDRCAAAAMPPGSESGHGERNNRNAGQGAKHGCILFHSR
jgi:hypothetical protein